MKRIAAACLLICLMLLAQYALADLEVHFLDVGHGDCAIVRNGEHCMVIDGGTSGKSDFLFSYLKKMGVKHIDAAVATHPDADHIGGLPAAFHAAEVNTLYVLTLEDENDRHKTLIKTATTKKAEIKVPANGESFELGDAAVSFLVPRTGKTNESIIVAVSYGAKRFLFCADATKDAEMLMLDNGDPVAADVIKIAHHGSDSSSSMQFLLAVSPEYAVISGNNRYASPDDEVPSKLLAINATLLHTLQNGHIVISTDGEKISIACEKQYVGNINSGIFHRSSCPSVARMKESNKKPLYTREQAIHTRYDPCKNCEP